MLRSIMNTKIQRFFDMGYRPDEDVIDIAVEELTVKSLDFLAENNIYLTKISVNQSAIDGNYWINVIMVFMKRH